MMAKHESTLKQFAEECEVLTNCMGSSLRQCDIPQSFDSSLLGGLTVFHVAALRNNVSAVKILLAAGLKANTVAAADASKRSTPCAAFAPVHCAVFSGAVDVLQVLPLESLVCPELYLHSTPLILSIRFGQSDTALYLLRRFQEAVKQQQWQPGFANRGLRPDTTGANPLHHLVRCIALRFRKHLNSCSDANEMEWHRRAFQVLVALLDFPSVDSAAVDLQGNNALHYASLFDAEHPESNPREDGRDVLRPELFGPIGDVVYHLCLHGCPVEVENTEGVYPTDLLPPNEANGILWLFAHRQALRTSHFSSRSALNGVLLTAVCDVLKKSSVDEVERALVLSNLVRLDAGDQLMKIYPECKLPTQKSSLAPKTSFRKISRRFVVLLLIILSIISYFGLSLMMW